MDIITIKRFECPKCGHDQLNKKGYTPDGRQRLKCLKCGKSSTVGVRKMGEAKFDPSKLLPIMHKDPSEFTREELYSLGWLIADGSISKTNQLSITVHPDDDYCLDIIRLSLGIKNTIKQAKCGKKGDRYSRITWAYKHATPYWEKIGMIQGKTGNEMWLPYMENHHFIRGFLDGDGCISVDRRITFSCSCLSFSQLLQSHIFNQIKNLGTLGHSRGVYNLSYYGTYAKKLGEYLYEDSEGLRLERKYQKWLEI